MAVMSAPGRRRSLLSEDSTVSGALPAGSPWMTIVVSALLTLPRAGWALI
jgi:hypothetical protein